jgi:hypothetical protein
MLVWRGSESEKGSISDVSGATNQNPSDLFCRDRGCLRLSEEGSIKSTHLMNEKICTTILLPNEAKPLIIMIPFYPP